MTRNDCDGGDMREERTRRLMAAVGTFDDALTQLEAIPLREYPRHAAQLARIRLGMCADLREALANLREIAQVVLLAPADPPGCATPAPSSTDEGQSPCKGHRHKGRSIH